MSRRARTIAWHEYITNVRRREFLLVTLGLPAMILLFGGLGALGTLLAGNVIGAHTVRQIGLVDRSHLLAHVLEAEPDDETARLVPFATEQDGMAALMRGSVESLIIVDRAYLRTGSVTIYRKHASIFSPGTTGSLGPLLTRGLLAGSRLQPDIVQRAAMPLGPDGPRQLVLDDSGRFVKPDAAREAARLVVPYAFTILLTTSIFFSASYLLRGLADEKENRVIEVILSSVSADELLIGKLVGLAGVGLTQIAIWYLLGGLPATIMFAKYIQVPGMSLVYAALFFALGYSLYAAMMAGLGALGTSNRESQQVSGVFSIFAFLPFVFIPVLLEFPNGMLARLLSLIPFTAPATMVLRITATDVPPDEIATSAIIIALTTWVVIRISAKLFRFGLLIYGKRPGVRETLRAMRSA